MGLGGDDLVSDIIQIKRSTVSGNVPTLQSGEPAINLADHRLYIGGGAPGGYPLAGLYPWLKRTGASRIAQVTVNQVLVSVNMVANRLVASPFAVPKVINLTGLGINVTTSAAGTAEIGIYNNIQTSAGDNPGTLLASVTGLDISTVGDKTGSVSMTLYPGQVYWAGMIATGAINVRAVPYTGSPMMLGYVPNTNNSVTYLYKDAVGTSLPATAPTDFSFAQATATHALYLIS